MQSKRRSLALTTEAACHPFRQSLPPHVCKVLIAEPEEPPRWHRIDANDVRGFLTAYCAMFLAVMVFIS